MKPNSGALRDILAGGGKHAQLRAVLGLNHIVPAAAEKDLPHHCRWNDILALPLRRGDRDVMRADRDRRRRPDLDCLATASQRRPRKVDPRSIETLAFDNVA